MRKQFIFDLQKETATAYLTRMSPILGAMRNDSVSVANPHLISSISLEEKVEIENEACKAFEKTISTETKRMTMRMIIRTSFDLQFSRTSISSITRLIYRGVRHSR